MGEGMRPGWGACKAQLQRERHRHRGACSLSSLHPLQDKGQAELAEHLPKSVGWGMGLEFRESHLQLTAKNATLVRPGMVFNVSLGACQPCDRCRFC